jgi:hypothetical protein
MPQAEKLFRFPARLMLRRFYGTAIIRFEAGKVTHVQTETRRMWRHRDLLDEPGSTPIPEPYPSRASPLRRQEAGPRRGQRSVREAKGGDDV